MIGIYKITNLKNGKFYIGQTQDIVRRFAEHKAKSLKGKEVLYQEMRKYGIENFKFEVIEKCNPEELNTKELHYIRTLKPSYNFVGRQRTPEEKEKISRQTKKWWNDLDEITKQKIIKNNLKRPKKGHEVKESTRQKLREWVIENQGQKVMIVETGEVFNKIKDLENYLGACTGTCAAYWKGKIKSVKGFHVVKV